METLCGPIARADPGVFKGDLHFYRVDGDLRGRNSSIDTARLPALSADGANTTSPASPKTPCARAAGHSGRAGGDHEGLGPFPDEREPRAVPAIHRAGVLQQEIQKQNTR